MFDVPLLRRIVSGSATLALGSLPLGAETPVAHPESELGEIIVKLREPGAMLPFRDTDILGIELADGIGSGGEWTYRFSLDTFLSVDGAAAMEVELAALAAELRARPDVLYAHPNWIVKPATGRPGSQDDRIYLSHVAADTSVRASVGQAVIAVLDQGVPPAQATAIQGFDMVSDPGRAGDGDGRDADPGAISAISGCGQAGAAEHAGWPGADLIAALDADMPRQAVILSLRVMGPCDGTIADIDDAIRWAAGLDVPGIPANPHPAEVIALRFSAPVACRNAPALQAAINDATAAGARILANADPADGQGLPGDCDRVEPLAAMATPL